MHSAYIYIPTYTYDIYILSIRNDHLPPLNHIVVIITIMILILIIDESSDMIVISLVVGT